MRSNQTGLRVFFAKATVRVANAAALPAHAAVGGVDLVANVNGALPAIDGVTLAVGDRLLYWQGVGASATYGVYQVVTLGSASTPWRLTRTRDARDAQSLVPGLFVEVTEGASLADRFFQLTTNAPLTVGTTALAFTATGGGGFVPAHAAQHQHGGGDEVATATPGANAIPKAGAGGTLDAGWLPFPLSDAVFIVGDNADLTRRARFEVAAVDAGQTRVVTIPNQNVDLTPGTGSYAASANVGSWLLVSETLTTGVAQPLSLADALFTGQTAGGSTSGAGTQGVVAISTGVAATETGGGAGQANLGNNNPLADAAFAGQRGIKCQLRRVDGDDVKLIDVLSTAPAAEFNAKVYGYLSFRSDLGADLKWRFWFYFTATNGTETAFTPNTSIANAKLLVPKVVASGGANIASFFIGGVVAGQAAAGVGPGSISETELATALASRVPTQGENDALAGTVGAPGSANRYVTETDSAFAGILGGNGYHGQNLALTGALTVNHNFWTNVTLAGTVTPPAASLGGHLHLATGTISIPNGTAFSAAGGGAAGGGGGAAGAGGAVPTVGGNGSNSTGAGFSTQGFKSAGGGGTAGGIAGAGGNATGTAAAGGAHQGGAGGGGGGGGGGAATAGAAGGNGGGGSSCTIDANRQPKFIFNPIHLETSTIVRVGSGSGGAGGGGGGGDAGGGNGGTGPGGVTGAGWLFLSAPTVTGAGTGVASANGTTGNAGAAGAVGAAGTGGGGGAGGSGGGGAGCVVIYTRSWSGTTSVLGGAGGALGAGNSGGAGGGAGGNGNAGGAGGAGLEQVFDW